MAQVQYIKDLYENEEKSLREISRITGHSFETVQKYAQKENWSEDNLPCLLYTSPSPRDLSTSRMPSSA